MCGIAGIYKFNQPVTADDVAAVKKMTDAQIHRGPDGEGIVALHASRHAPHTLQPSVVLGHRRLSIIDLSEAGRQPMSNEACPECRRGGGTVWVTYNGEIYNYRELREELAGKGHAFRSQTDTEVLAHGYGEWGIEGLLSRLRGMFAFALYDARSSLSSSPLTSHPSRLILARDRFGIKPLYYGEHGGLIAFASEVRALMASGLLPPEENPRARIAFLLTGSVPVPWTTFKAVHALPAGHYLIADEGGVALQPYWDLSATQLSALSSQHSAITTTRSLLEDSVGFHLISDAPLGVFLSGGIDSSALTALAALQRQKPVTTLSVVFEEAAYSEASHQRAVAARYGTDHREVLIRGKDFRKELPSVFGAMDQPTIDGVNTYFIAKAAKEAGLKAVLSGLGGDEVFWGYSSFRRIGRLRAVQRLPSLLRAPLRMAGVLPGSRRRLEYLSSDDPLSLYLTVRGLFTRRETAKLLGCAEREVREVFEALTPERREESPEAFLQRMECDRYLQNQLLKDTDFMSMAHSVEIRVPFLDHPLVEYVAGLPSGAKLQAGVNKPLLVKALGDDLPRAIWNRPKMGFIFPFGEWMREGAEELEAGSHERAFLDRKAAKSIWDGFKAGRVHWSRPWALVVLQRWMK